MSTLILLLEIALNLFSLYIYTFDFKEHKGFTDDFLVYYKIVIDQMSGLQFKLLLYLLTCVK